MVKYILAGKCKRNVFGKLTLPSGGEVPRSIRGWCLWERFDKYHRQHPNQQAAPGYLETLARTQRPTPQSAISAAPLAMEATSLNTEAKPPTMPKTPEHMPCTCMRESNFVDTKEALGVRAMFSVQEMTW